MKPIEDLLKNLARPEVLEFGLVTNRLPSVNIGGKFEPVDDEAPSTEKLLEMLVTMGGSRYVESLSDKPVQWTTRLDGVGVIAVAAIMRKDVVQARFTVARRDPQPGRSAAPMATTQQGPPPTTGSVRPPENKTSQAPPQVAAARPAQPGPQFARTQQGTGTPAAAPSPQPTSSSGPAAAKTSVPPQAAAKPVTLQSVGTQASPSRDPKSSSPQPVAKAQPQSAGQVATAAPATTPQGGPSKVPPPPPPSEEWDDDDEPTVQTLSPPVAPPQRDGEEPKPKPARKPDEVSRETGPQAAPVTAPQTPEAKAAGHVSQPPMRASGAPPADAQRAAQERAAQEKAAQERAAQERAAQERAAQERAAQERAAQERAAQERATQERAAQERAAQEKAVAEQRAAEQRAAVERAAQERAAAAERRAAAERKLAEERAILERARGGGPRINTPTSVDAVDVEITTTDTGQGSVTVDQDAEGTDNTVEVRPSAGSPGTPPAQTQASGRSVTAAMQSVVPSTAPSAVERAAPDKERPRVEAAALESFFAMAVQARASDIHVVAGRPLLLRVASDLLPRTQAIAAEQVERIVRETVPARLRETLEKEGACDFAEAHPQHGRFRIHVSRQRSGFKLSMRVVPREIPTLASLGLPEAVSPTKLTRGLVLVTGPSGHGKTTTLAAMVDALNREGVRRIFTLEDPIEFVHARKRSIVTHRELGLHVRTLASGLHAAAREDADVVVIGELRDAEATRLAVRAAESGQLVLATMNASGATRAIERALEAVVSGDIGRAALASVLRLVVGQRLVPSADRTRLHLALECLPATTALYTSIRDGRTQQLPALHQRAKSLGTLRLEESLDALVRAQKVTLEVARQYADVPTDVEGGAPARAPAAAASGAPAAVARKA